MRTTLIGLIFIALAIATFFVVFYVNSRQSEIPPVFSSREMLLSLWLEYKEEYLEEGTFRTLDRQQGNITTSEGQSYTMLRAVWMDDKEVFDESWQWTKDNLGREEDALISWLFGEREDGTFGVLVEEGGYNSASDADVDIALALIFAYARWREDEYLGDAIVLINDIWEKEVVTVNGTPYLAANNLEKSSADPEIIINPSYFAPYAYRIFEKIDPGHDWIELAESSYDLLRRSIQADLDAEESAGLPPEWIVMNRETGEISAPQNGTLTTNYSYNALRVPWRIALDYKWSGEPDAQEVLEMMDFLGDEWEQKQTLYSRYSHGGEILLYDEVPAMYGGSIGYFLVAAPDLADDVYDNKLKILYNPDSRTWETEVGYYSSNWAWFGMALYTDNLPNLAASISDEVWEGEGNIEES